MESERVPAAMLTAALLAPATELTSRERSLVISHVAPFNVASLPEAADAIAFAFHRAGMQPPSSRISRRPRFDRAYSRVEQWLRRGVFLAAGERVRASDACLDSAAPVLFGFGQQEILGRETAVVVNSRKSRRITPGELWVDAVKAFCYEASGENLALASSYGTLWYDLVCRLAHRSGAPLLVACDGVLPFMDSAENEARFIAHWGELFPPDRTLFLSPFPPGLVPKSGERLQERDRLCLSLASRIYVVAVRRGGTMESSLQQVDSQRVHMTMLVDETPDKATEGNIALLARHGTAKVERRPASTIPRTRVPCGSGTEPSASRGLLVLAEWPEQGSVLVHYTRSCPGPWPGESLGTYVDAILDSLPSAGHTGFDTLMRILEEDRIRASGKLTRGGRPVVSWTECRPAELQDMIRWRKGLIRWSFEPYGVAVDRKCLEDLGAETVIYGDNSIFATLPEERRHLFQLDTAAGPDWKVEKEWRILGDLILHTVPRDKLTVFVADLDEARTVSDRFGYRVTLAGYARKSNGLARK